MIMWTIVMFPLLLAPACAFMIHNSGHSLCLEESAVGVVLRPCSLDSESQQWMWMDQSMLVSVASSRCLSALQVEPLQTRPCTATKADHAGLLWDCDRDRIISRTSSMMLSVDGGRLVLTHNSRQSRWRSVDGGDVCQERLRSRRASNEPEEFEETVAQKGELPVMTDEQKEYLRWFYRTEDPTVWKFVLLGLAFVCLLIGFMLLGMGAMANKNRKKIAKYKAAAALAQSDGEQLRIILAPDDSGSRTPSLAPHANKAEPSNGDATELRAGNIVVTWKDGNTSCLYPDHIPEEEQEKTEQAEEQEQQEKEEEEEQQEKEDQEQQEALADPGKAME